MIIKPQPTQEQFLSNNCNIVIFGGRAGGGKSWSLLLDPIRYIKDPLFNAQFFRRTYAQITGGGGLWDTSKRIYPALQAKPVSLNWIFPSGAKFSMNHLQHDKDIYSHDGKQYSWIGFDELQHFTANQFWYLFSRNRSVSESPAQIRATCNPAPDSWLSDLLSWWIGEDGYIIPEKSGQVRYFLRYNDQVMWVDKDYKGQENYIPETKQYIKPISITFISSTLEDNKELLKTDPEYRTKLMMLGESEKARLLHGNWKYRSTQGLVMAGYDQGNWLEQPIEYKKDDYRYVLAGYDRGFTHRAGIVVIGVTYTYDVIVLYSAGLSGLNFISNIETDNSIYKILKFLQEKYNYDVLYCSHEANDHIDILRKNDIDARSWMQGLSNSKAPETTDTEKTKTNTRLEFTNTLFFMNKLKFYPKDHTELRSDLGKFSYKKLPDGSYNMNETIKEFDDVIDALTFSIVGYSILYNEIRNSIYNLQAK